MINSYKTIASDDPTRQVWRFLRFFLDANAVESRIRAIHNIGAKKEVDHVKKQARQLTYCIRQAEEYFAAASQVGLATRPLLLYYGAVSLTQALILLRRSGEYSYDYMRKSNKPELQRRHGLELNRGAIETIRANQPVESLLSSISYTHESVNGELRGHFARLLPALSCDAARCNVVRMQPFSTISTVESQTYPVYDLSEDWSTLIGANVSILELWKLMPDMYWMLRDVNVQSDLFPCDVTRRVQPYLVAGKTEPTRFEVTVEYQINSISTDEQGQFLEYYVAPDGRFEVKFRSESSMIVVWKSMFTDDPDDEALDDSPVTLPSLYESVHGEHFIVKTNVDHITDLVHIYSALYCLGMLSRYYPDIWMSIVDHSSVCAELVDYFLGVVHRKFPNLILDQMTGVKHYIHT